MRPMYWAERGGKLLVRARSGHDALCLSLYEAPMRKPEGFSVTLSPFRRPSPEMTPSTPRPAASIPTMRAPCSRRSRAASTIASMRDALGNVAELATSNVFIGKDGVVFTPVPNGTFLAGITRQRVIELLRDAGVSVVETALSYADIESADEIFSSGNYSKVMPVTRIDQRALQPGPLYRKARELYWEFAHG